MLRQGRAGVWWAVAASLVLSCFMGRVAQLVVWNGVELTIALRSGAIAALFAAPLAFLVAGLGAALGQGSGPDEDDEDLEADAYHGGR